MLRVSAFCALVSSLGSAFLPPQQLQQYGRAAHLFAEKNDNDLVGNLGKAALQVGADFFVALRWGAANAITAALPEEQRKVLLERMDPEPPKYLMSPADPSNKKKSEDGNDEFEDEMVIKNSVNEAVAAAVAVQSQREKKWEKEKKCISRNESTGSVCFSTCTSNYIYVHAAGITQISLVAKWCWCLFSINVAQVRFFCRKWLHDCLTTCKRIPGHI